MDEQLIEKAQTAVHQEFSWQFGWIFYILISEIFWHAELEYEGGHIVAEAKFEKMKDGDIEGHQDNTLAADGDI